MSFENQTQIRNIIEPIKVGPIEYFMAHGELPNISINPSNNQQNKIKPEAKEKVSKEDRIKYSREFHEYFGKLMKGCELNQDEMKQHIVDGIKYCPSTVTTHLLYATDPRGMDRVDIFETALPFVVACRPGFTFHQTLVRGLVRQDAWKLICAFIRDDIGAKVVQFVFETLAWNIKHRNRRCLRSLPRQGKVSNRLRGFMKMKPAKWRHTLSKGSRGSITSFMSSNDWSKIEYKLLNIHILSKNYRAFMRHDRDRFVHFLESNPDTAAAVKRVKYYKAPYLSQKEIYDKYVVPMKKEEPCQSIKV